MTADTLMTRRALLSVSNKAGLIAFAQALREVGYDIISTGGTATVLADAGVDVLNVSDVTGFPEMLEGRVKTLHPGVHGGILADRSKPDHVQAIADHNIQPIDLVCVNLYPFASTVANPDVTLEEAIENIDIGGPAMIRSAAKNHNHVVVVVDPADYEALIAELRSEENGVGGSSLATRRRLAAKSFGHTWQYDAYISLWLSQRFAQENGEAPPLLPEAFAVDYAKAQVCRYGENPHQDGRLLHRRQHKRNPAWRTPGRYTAKNCRSTTSTT